MGGQLYEIAVTATGEVRDAEGNLISSSPVEMTAVVTQEELNEILNNQEKS